VTEHMRCRDLAKALGSVDWLEDVDLSASVDCPGVVSIEIDGEGRKTNADVCRKMEAKRRAFAMNLNRL
jgi:hypothetical protein